MQAPESRPKTLHVPQTPPRTNPSLKITSSPSPINKTPKGRNSKAVDRRSPRTPATEKKRPIRVLESEPNSTAQLQDELKKVKEQLTLSESSKKRAQQDAEEANKKLESMISQLEQAQNQIKEISDSEEARVHELRKLSQERDRAWKSELDALQKQHSMDSAALASALNEIQRLKTQMHELSESKASQARYAESACDEIQSLKGELNETFDLVERLKRQVNDSRESEARALEEVDRVRMMMEEALKKSEEMLRLSHNDSTVEARNKSLEIELGESKERVKSLEELVAKLQMDLSSSPKVKTRCEDGEFDDKSEMLESEEDDSLRHEVSRLRDALDAAERKLAMFQIDSLEKKLEESMAEIDSNEDYTLEKESELKTDLKNSEPVLENLQINLHEKEKQLHSITEENETLKSKITEMETEISKSNKALSLAEDTERETSSKIGYLTEEANKSCEKAARISEQLDAAEAEKAEMEAELRRLKVQSDQWRKAAEAATSMLSNGNGVIKFNEKMRSFDSNTIGGKLGLPYYEDLDDESPKKKKGNNVLKNIGGLLKKGHK